MMRTVMEWQVLSKVHIYFTVVELIYNSLPLESMRDAAFHEAGQRSAPFAAQETSLIARQHFLKIKRLIGCEIYRHVIYSIFCDCLFGFWLRR